MKKMIRSARMKKLVLATLTFAVLVSLAGCGNATALSATETGGAQAVTMSASPSGGQHGTTMAKQPSASYQSSGSAQSAGSTQQAAAASQDEIKVTANGFTVEVVSAERSQDAQGNDIVLVYYRFTNNSGSSAAFWQYSDQTVKQDGKTLATENIVCDYSVFANAYTEISSGQSITCSYPYQVISGSNLDITVSIFERNSHMTVGSASGTIAIG